LGFDRPIGEDGWASASRLRVVPGQKIGEPKPVFRKIEEKDLSRVRIMLG
jgi:hypothetical protein